jgi:hypothetical protein
MEIMVVMVAGITMPGTIQKIILLNLLLIMDINLEVALEALVNMIHQRASLL